MVEELLQKDPDDRIFALISPRPGRSVEREGADALCGVGITVLVRETHRHDDGRFDIATVGQRRFRIDSLDTSQPLLRADISLAPDLADPDDDVLALAAARTFTEYRHVLAHTMGVDADLPDELPEDPLVLSYLMTASLVVDAQERFELLDLDHVSRRLQRAEVIARREIALLTALHSVPALDLIIEPSVN